MKKSRIASPVPHPESSLRHLPLVDLLVANHVAVYLPMTGSGVSIDRAERGHTARVRRWGERA